MFPIGTQIRIYFGAGWHHGIYIGNDRVIHLSDDVGGKSSDRKRRSKVHECSLQEFYGNNDLPEPVFESKCFGFAESYTRGDDYEAVKRAQAKLGQGEYNLFFNNCEHFAVYCKTGRYDSVQVMNVIEDLAQPSVEIPIVGDIPVVGSAVEEVSSFVYNSAKSSSSKVVQHVLCQGGARNAARWVEDFDNLMRECKRSWW